MFSSIRRGIACQIRQSGRTLSTFEKHQEMFEILGITKTQNKGVFDGTWKGSGPVIPSLNPVNNEVIAEVISGSPEDLSTALDRVKEAQKIWSEMPAPARGQVLLSMRNTLVHHLEPLGKLVALEMGKILPEGIGEVQEVVDILEYAVGLSRMPQGSIIPSERPGHVMLETWNPLGTVGVISAFNFPVAVYGWNSAIALATGNGVLWKPSPSTPLCSIVLTRLMEKVWKEHQLPPALSSLVTGGSAIGQALAEDARTHLLSFTGSTRVGRQVGLAVQRRFGKKILELGGNNAILVMEDADLALAERAILFSAVGTAGQRCTTTRRLLVHEQISDTLLSRLIKAYEQVKVGDPLTPQVLCGPLHTKQAVRTYEQLIQDVKSQGGEILTGGRVLKEGPLKKGNFVAPTLTKTLDEAVAIHNQVSQGLSSAIFTRDPAAIFRWIGPAGSDCGIINVNIPTSGAEIGGAFGGEKETGGGRESGSDSWKQYCRRGTCTINYSGALPLAQGIHFA